MKKLIIFSILALSFNTVSPSLAAEIDDSQEVQFIQERAPNVLPVSQDVKPVVELVVDPSIAQTVPVAPPTPCINSCPTPVKYIDAIDDTITVTPPCINACPNPNPVITPANEIVISPCSTEIAPMAAFNMVTSQNDHLVIPNDPCPPITPVIQINPTGTGGGSVILATNVLPVSAPAEVEMSTEVPGQKVLGEQKVVMESTPVPSFPKTGGAPITPSTPTAPTNTSNAIMNFSFNNDRKRENLIV
jgi:hypothetical protein